MAPKAKFASPPKSEAKEAATAHEGTLPQQDKFLNRRLLYMIFACRIAMSLFLLKGSDVPDEWWQSTEVAYRQVFGKGELPLEWRNETAIRSFIYPAPYAVAFSVLKTFGLDTSFFIWLAPKVIAAAIATGVDAETYRIARYFDTSPDDEGVTVGKVALLFSVCHWFTAYIGLRTESNVLEALVFLVVIQQSRYVPFLIVAGFGCAIRPTAVILFLPFAAAHWLNALQRGGAKAVVFLVLATAIVTTAWLAAVAWIDSQVYGTWTCTPWNFFSYNVLEGRSAWYGTHSWHWYVSAALPAMAMPYTPLLLLLLLPSTWQLPVPSKITAKLAMCCVTVVFTIMCYSTLPHKEMRFVYPLVPIFIAISAFLFLHHPFVHATENRAKRLLKAFVVVNVLTFLFIGTTYRRGPLDVMGELRFYPTSMQSLHVLTSCYNLPGHSYAHGAVIGELRGLDCTLVLSPGPDGDLSDKKITETDLFNRDPVAFVGWVYSGVAPKNKTLHRLLNSTVVGGSWQIPEAVVMYASTALTLNSSFLEKFGFEQKRSLFHTLILVEDDEDYWIELWQRNLTAAALKESKGNKLQDRQKGFSRN